jgi:hypothetical protein
MKTKREDSWSAAKAASLSRLPLIVAFTTGVMTAALALESTDLASSTADPSPAMTRLLASLDLQRPDMAEVRAAIEAGDTTKAACVWRSIAIARLRRSELGTFDYHVHHLRNRKLLADSLVGIIDPKEYASKAAPNEFLDLYNISSPPGSGTVIDWTASATDPLTATAAAYGTFNFGIPLAARYWETNDPIYLRKWLEVVSDYALRQRPAMELLPEANRPRGNSPWIVGGDTCILQSQKVLAIIRSLAVLAKALPSGEEAGPREWDRALAPVMIPPLESATVLFDPDQLAAIILSLTIDDPPLLLDLYEATRAPPNQRCLGLTSLLMIASQFPEVQGMATLLKRAGAAMHDHVLNNFHPDGGMLEQSLNYNLGDAEKLRQVGRMLRGDDPPGWLADLAARLALYDRMIVSLRTPAGELPVIGNNTSNPPALWRSGEVRDQWFGDRSRAVGRPDVARLGFTSVAFPYSGYYVQRDSWDWGSGYLFFMNARPAAGHCTMDNLAIELHALGRPLLVRGGPPHYALQFLPQGRRADADAIDRYFSERSSFKVNTIVVDGQSQVRDGPVATKPQEEPIPSRWHSSTAFDFVEGRYELGYGDRTKPMEHVKDVTHFRQVIHFRDIRCWLVVDWMQSQVAASHAYTQIWKLPPYLDPKDGGGLGVCGFKQDQVVIDAEGFHTADPAGPNLWVYQAGSQPLAREIRFGESNPYLGWYARQIGDLVPAADVHVCFGGRGATAVVTLLAPADGDTSPFTLGRRDATALADVPVTLEAVHRDGTVLTVTAAPHGPMPLTAGPVTARATLLVVQADRTSVKGLALGCAFLESRGSQITPQGADFEFESRDGSTSVVAPVERPRGFSWIDTPRSSRPRYAQ